MAASFHSAFLVATWVLGSAGWASTLSRPSDPVVMTGSTLPTLVGRLPGRIVAFRYSEGWHQIPVQIDERKQVDFGLVYNSSATGILTLTYTDPNTYCGSDSDPNFDSDDELVFMARDAGDRAGPGAGEPASVISSGSIEVRVEDPLTGGVGYVYLFVSDGSLLPGAGVDYISYGFNLLSGTYIPNYRTQSGPNPEDSAIVSPYYRTHFSDRWVCNELNLYAGGASGADILDRHKSLFGPGVCQRTETTFSNGEGAFFVNKDGPVRALRSYMGANSGPLTQRTHVFYDRRQDVLTNLRVHAIPGIMDLYDYSAQATGMYYYNNLNTQGVLVNGVPDTVTAGSITWEMATGSQGSLVISHQIQTNVSPFSYTTYYSDDSTPSATQCTGDAWEYATSGVWINVAIPNTDPSTSPYKNLLHARIVHYDGPGLTAADAALRNSQANTPLTLATAAYTGTCTLHLTVVNGTMGVVSWDPAPADPNTPAYAVGTLVTLSAIPNDGRAFNRWLVYDPNHPGDANHAVEDANTVLHLTFDANWEVEAAFKCGGSGLLFPLGLMLCGSVALSVIRRNRR